MPLRTALAETLEAWREAESLLAELPPLSPDHETVRLTVLRLHSTYQALTDAAPQTALAVASSQETIRDARTVLARIRAGRQTFSVPPVHSVGAGDLTPSEAERAMDVREPVAISVFPHDDHALRAHAETLIETIHDPAELERRLRSVYPRVAVRQQTDLARHVRRRWYVYRDGSAVPDADDEDWGAPGTGTLLISREGTYLSADDEAADIYGVPVEAIPGARVGAFTRHDGSDEGGRRAFERLAETGSLSSTAVVKVSDGREWPIHYRIELDGDAYRMLVRRREG